MYNSFIVCVCVCRINVFLFFVCLFVFEAREIIMQYIYCIYRWGGWKEEDDLIDASMSHVH